MNKARESKMPRSWEMFFNIFILYKIWRKVPELRLGQLIQNLGDVYYYEDNKLFKELAKIYKIND